MGHPFVNIAFFALLCFLVQGDSFVRHVKPEADVRHRQVEVPTTNSFRRRALHSSECSKFAGFMFMRIQ